MPRSSGSQISQSTSWHARHFCCAPNSYPYVLLFLFSCSILRHRLDHSNVIEWENSTLFCFASCRTQRGETDWQSVFLLLCVYHCSPCFYYYILCLLSHSVATADHSNVIEGATRPLFCLSHFVAQQGETDRQSMFLCVCVLSYSPCFYHPSSLPSDDQYVKCQWSGG